MVGQVINFPNRAIYLAKGSPIQVWAQEVTLHALFNGWAEAVKRNLQSYGEPWSYTGLAPEIVCFSLYCRTYMEHLELLDGEETDDGIDGIQAEMGQKKRKTDSELPANGDALGTEKPLHAAHVPEPLADVKPADVKVPEEQNPLEPPVDVKPADVKVPEEQKVFEPPVDVKPADVKVPEEQKGLEPAAAKVPEEQKPLKPPVDVKPADVKVGEEQKSSEPAAAKVPEEQKPLKPPVDVKPADVKVPEEQKGSEPAAVKVPKVFEPPVDVKPADVKVPEEQKGSEPAAAKVPEEQKPLKPPVDVKPADVKVPEEQKGLEPSSDVKVPDVRGSDRPPAVADAKVSEELKPSEPAAEIKAPENKNALQPVPAAPVCPKPQKTAVIEMSKAAPKAPPALQTAVAVNRAATVPNGDNRPVSSTLNRSEYMVFLRRGKNLDEDDPAKKMFQSGGHQRRELFKLWMQSSKDFAQVQLEISRKRTERARADSKEGGMTRLELTNSGKYTATEVQELVERLERQGHYIHDPNFPDREDKYLYFVHQDISMLRQSEREDSTTLAGTLQVQDQEALGQILRDGELADNSTPSMLAILPSSCSRTLPALPQGEVRGDPNAGKEGNSRKGKSKKEAKAKNKGSKPGEQETHGESADGDGQTERVKVTTAIDKAKSARKAILKEGEEARSLAISIEGLECSSDVVSTLEKHAANMTDLYKEINMKILAGDNEESSYEKIYKTQESFTTWFKARKKIAKSMKAAAESGAK